MIYEIWAMAIDTNLKDGYDDTLIATFEHLEGALWFVDNYSWKKIPNTKIVIQEVDYDDIEKSYGKILLEKNLGQ